jgi:hypothetical protein
VPAVNAATICFTLPYIEVKETMTYVYNHPEKGPMTISVPPGNKVLDITLDSKQQPTTVRLKTQVYAADGLHVSHVSQQAITDVGTYYAAKSLKQLIAANLSGKGDAAVIVEGTVNGTARKFTYEVSFPEEASKNEFIPRLWATRRVGYLLDEIRLHGENAELRDEVTELARKYSIVTPYTAYLILEDETHRNVPMPMRSLQSFDGDRSGGVRDPFGNHWWIATHIEDVTPDEIQRRADAGVT